MSDEVLFHTSECGTNTHHNRFGDVLCSRCGVRVGWDWRLVRDGVYGERTLRWVRSEAERLRHEDPITLAVGDWYVTRHGLQTGAHPRRRAS